MANVGQIYYKLLIPGNPGGFQTSSNISSIFGKDNDIVPKIAGGSGYFTKVSVQAPPGTEIIFNETNAVMVGRTGIYDLDDVKITSMYFVRPIIYKKNDDKTNASLASGKEKLREAWQYWVDHIYPLKLSTSNSTDDYINYRSYSETYQSLYEDALNIFNQGYFGIYEKDDEANADLYNIVIDFMYEQQ